MPGPAPQDRKHGRTPNASSDWREIDDVPFAGRPLPALPNRAKWHPLVESWWESTSTMPHCVLWRDEDWQKAVELAYEKQRYYKANDDDKTTAILTEIRRREDELGIGYAARLKLRIRYKQKTEPGAAGEGPDGVKVVVEGAVRASGNVVPLAQRRANITKTAAAG